MGRLTDRKTATDLKANADSLRALGFEPTISDQRYIKLAEYENAEELIKTTTHAPVLSYQTAAIKAVLEGKGVKCRVKVIDKPKADAETVKHAKWEICSDGYYPFCCKKEPQSGKMTLFCPNCGAKMKKEEYT